MVRAGAGAAAGGQPSYCGGRSGHSTPPQRQRRRLAAGFPSSRLARTIALLPGTVENVNPLRHSPWQETLPAAVIAAALDMDTAGEPHTARAAAFREWLNSGNPHDWVLYTDGSKIPDGRTGAGWVIYRGTSQIISGNLACSSHREVFDAEAIALRNGLRAAHSHGAVRWVNDLWVCLDNQAAIRRTLNPLAPSLSSQQVIHEAADLLNGWGSAEGPNARVPVLEAPQGSAGFPATPT